MKMMVMAKDGAKDSGKKDADLAAMFKRLPSEQIKKLCELAQAELDSRDGKDVSGMSDAEFQKYVSALFDKADKAAREADLREQLAGKSNKSDNPKDKKKGYDD